MKRFKNFGRVLGVVILAVLIILAALTYWHPGTRTTAKAPTATTRTNRRSTVRLVALGDSLTQGVGDQKKQGGYTGRIQAMVHKKDHVKVIMHNYGLAGDRSDQIEKRLLKSQAQRKQVARAQAITLTVGGNDLLQTLTKNVTINQQTRLSHQLDSAQTTYAKRLSSLLTTIRRYNGHAPIYLYSIYNPIYVYFANVNQITDAVDNWNKVTTKTAANFKNLYMVNINRELSVGQFRSVTQQAKLKRHAQKSNSGELSTQSFQTQILASDTQDELNDYLSPDDHFHPNAKGYNLMTNKLYQTMQQHPQWLQK